MENVSVFYDVSMTVHFRSLLMKQNMYATPSIISVMGITSSLPGRNGRHFADDILICVFMKEKFVF